MNVSIQLVHLFLEYARKIGVDPIELVRASKLESELLKDNEGRVPFSSLIEVWRILVENSNDPLCGIHLAQAIEGYFLKSSNNILFTIMMNCPNVGAAWEKFTKYSRIIVDGIEPVLNEDTTGICLSWEQEHFHKEVQSLQAGPLLISGYYTILKHLSQGRLDVLEVRFVESSSGNLAAYEDLFKAPIKFNAKRDELVISRDSFDLPLQIANKKFLSALEQYAVDLIKSFDSLDTWAGKVVSQTSQMIITGEIPDLAITAKKLGVSRRSLQNKLKEEQSTFRDCLETARKEIAFDCLKRPDNTITDVAFLLGYSEQSAFNHAFKRWSGKTPSDYKKYGATENFAGNV